MSVFKKLVGFLFEEDEEITEEGELSTVAFKDDVYEEKPVQKRPQPQPKPVVKEVIRTESVPVKKVQSTPVVKENALPPQEEKRFTNIEIEPVVVKKPAASTISSRKTTQRAEPVKSEFEFTPVISPIFGADEQTVRKAKPVSVPQNRTTIPTASKKNPLATIISPIYGSSPDDVYDDDDDVQEETFVTKAFVPVEHDEIEAMAFAPIAKDIDAFDDEDQEDIVSVPLEDLLTKEEVNETDEDLLQFSLFGDDEVVSSDNIKDTYTIKE